MDWKGKNALVTGGGTGIGREIALAFARRGANVALCGRTPRTIEAVAQEIRSMGSRALAIRADVGEESAVAQMAASIEKEMGTLDVLVNNAGTIFWSKLLSLSTEDWERVLRTNLTGPFLVTRAFLPAMVARKSGAVVFIASTSGKKGDAGGVVYSATKFGIMGFAQSLLYEVRKENIRVIVVTPSRIDTGREAPDPAKVEQTTAHASDVAASIVAALDLPPRALVREIEIWGTNP